MTSSRGERASVSSSARSSAERSARRRDSNASLVETSWTTTLCPRASAATIAGRRLGSFIDRRSAEKKRCLAPSNRDRAEASAWPPRVPPVQRAVTPAAAGPDARGEGKEGFGECGSAWSPSHYKNTKTHH